MCWWLMRQGGRGWSEARVKPRERASSVSSELDRCSLTEPGFPSWKLSPTPATPPPRPRRRQGCAWNGRERLVRRIGGFRLRSRLRPRPCEAGSRPFAGKLAKGAAAGAGAARAGAGNEDVPGTRQCVVPETSNSPLKNGSSRHTPVCRSQKIRDFRVADFRVADGTRSVPATFSTDC